MRTSRSGLPALLIFLCSVVVVESPSSACAGVVEDLSRWLECEDCGPEVLAAVVALGDQATALLAQAAVNGPTPARLEELRLHLTGLYLAQRSSGPVESSSGQATAAPESLRTTVDRYLRSKVELERVRALQALAAIGSDASRAALVAIGDAVRDGRLGPIAMREWSRLAAATLSDSVVNKAVRTPRATEHVSGRALRSSAGALRGTDGE